MNSYSSFSNHDIQGIVRKEITATLTEIDDLSTWPEGWNGYDALPPKYEAIQYASRWIELFYQEVKEVKKYGRERLFHPAI